MIVKNWNDQTSKNSWTDKQTVLHPYNGLLLGNKKEINYWSYSNTDEFQMHYVSERNQNQKATFYMIPLIRPSGIGKIIGTKSVHQQING